ncbi:MAG TPA: hypothetical protein VGF70_12135 [Solirubrobacteraceae bacterium]
MPREEGVALGGGGGAAGGGIVVPSKTRMERYEVDVRQVADAIMARIMAAGAVPAAGKPHRVCSKPVSSPSASTKTASG